MALTLIYRIILVECRHFHKEWHISCFLSEIIRIYKEDARGICDHVWTQPHFDKFLSSLRRNSVVAYIDVLFCRVTNLLEVFLPPVTIYFCFVFEGGLEIWLQIRINITDGQLHQYFQSIKTLCRFYQQFYEHQMSSFILFVLRLDLDVSLMIIKLDESRGIVDESSLNIAAIFFPWLLFVVKVES